MVNSKTAIMGLLLLLLSACANNQSIKGNSIKTVAAKFITEFHDDDNYAFFAFDLPPNALVPDHTTRPRLIVFTENFKGYRLENNEEISANKGQVFYLENLFSKGFTNSKEASAYLVFELKKDKLKDKQIYSCLESGLKQIFSRGALVVCKSIKNQTLNIKRDTFLYRQPNHSSKALKSGQRIKIKNGDLLIQF